MSNNNRPAKGNPYASNGVIESSNRQLRDYRHEHVEKKRSKVSILSKGCYQQRKILSRNSTINPIDEKKEPQCNLKMENNSNTFLHKVKDNFFLWKKAMKSYGLLQDDFDLSLVEEKEEQTKLAVSRQEAFKYMISNHPSHVQWQNIIGNALGITLISVF